MPPAHQGCDPDLFHVGPLEECVCPQVTSVDIHLTGCAGNGEVATAVFTAIGVDLPDDCTYRWDFGDGSPEETFADPSAPHSYDTPGTYAVVVETECGACDDLFPFLVEIPACCEPEITDVCHDGLKLLIVRQELSRHTRVGGGDESDAFCFSKYKDADGHALDPSSRELRGDFLPQERRN